MRRISMATFLGLAFFAVGQTSAFAGGLYLNEFATPSMGVAGAGQEAVANDASTAFALHNPAGMTRLDGHHVQLGAGVIYGQTKFDTDADTPFNGGDGGNQAGWAPLGGSHFVFSATDDLKFGLGFFSVSGAALNPDDDWSGRYSNQKINLLTASINPSVAYRLNDWLSLSAGAIAMYADLDYELAAPPINPPTGGQGQVKVAGDDWAYGYNFGALIELSPRTRFGVTYVSKVEPDFSGDLKISPGAGPNFNTSSDVGLTFPQMVRVGAYHEINDQWALLGTVGWEDWSNFDNLTVSTQQGGAAIPTEWQDTYHFSGGVHYRPTTDWLLQFGITYDTSPVTDRYRTAYLPIDRQIRYAIGAQHQWTDNIKFGAAFEYMDMGDAKIDDPTMLTGEFEDNRIFALAFNLSYGF